MHSQIYILKCEAWIYCEELIQTGDVFGIFIESKVGQDYKREICKFALLKL